MIDRIREMNESQASSLAARRPHAYAAVLTALMFALTACGQKGPLFLPAQAGVAAKPADRSPSAPVKGASSPGQPPASN